MKVLVQGWSKIPHSYSIVNCFQLIHLNKYDDVEIFLQEVPYFIQDWENKKRKILPEEYHNILDNIKEWKGEDVDVIYRISYPYDIRMEVKHSKIPTAVFYTTEHYKLTPHYFKVQTDMARLEDEHIKKYLNTVKNLHFVCPSKWSYNGMVPYIEHARNKIITHGVDTSIFYKKTYEEKRELRKKYNITPEDIVFLNVGAMTRNKGISQILETVNILRKYPAFKSIKLLLKGTGDLYSSQSNVQVYLKEMTNTVTQEDVKELLGCIIFTDDTLSYENMNNLYNMADAYISPYIAEGFNMPILESITVGLPVFVSATGSTSCFVDDILTKVGDKYIIKLPSTVKYNEDGSAHNVLNTDDIVKTILEKARIFREMNFGDYQEKLTKYIKTKYTWEVVAKELHEYLLSLCS